MDNKEAFYFCEELNCGLYYREHSPIEQPVVETEVSVPKLFRKVKIKLLGMGEKGLKRLAKTGVTDLWPVDLFNKPYTIDPKVSRTCSEKMVERWDALVKDLNPKERKDDEEIYEEYMAEMDNPPIKDNRIKQSLIHWIKLVRNHEPSINSGVDLIDYMMTTEGEDDEW